VLVEEARNRDLFQEGVDAILPTAKERALQEWQANHWFDTYVDMGYGYRRLRRALDALIIPR